MSIYLADTSGVAWGPLGTCPGLPYERGPLHPSPSAPCSSRPFAVPLVPPHGDLTQFSPVAAKGAQSQRPQCGERPPNSLERRSGTPAHTGRAARGRGCEAERAPLLEECRGVGAADAFVHVCPGKESGSSQRPSPRRPGRLPEAFAPGMRAAPSSLSRRFRVWGTLRAGVDSGEGGGRRSPPEAPATAAAGPSPSSASPGSCCYSFNYLRMTTIRSLQVRYCVPPGSP